MSGQRPDGETSSFKNSTMSIIIAKNLFLPDFDGRECRFLDWRRFAGVSETADGGCCRPERGNDSEGHA
jgi:hypothetical protein